MKRYDTHYMEPEDIQNALEEAQEEVELWKLLAALL